MTSLESWVEHPYALLHGEDGEGRIKAMEAWKARHVDPEWVDFSLLVCSDNAPWPEVQNALCESAPLGVNRVVVVPQADHLLEKPKELPKTIQAILEKPLDGTCLLLVTRCALSAASGRTLGAKPFNEWEKQGRVLKVGALDARSAAAFIEQEAARMGLALGSGVAAKLAARMGGHPGILKRTLEVLELQCDGKAITPAVLEQVTFRLGEQSAFAWSQAWQKGTGNLSAALLALRQALEEDPGSGLMLLGQARKEVDRLLRLLEARRQGVVNAAQLLPMMGLSEKQAFLLDGYKRVLDRIGKDGAERLLHLINQTDMDLKGMSLSPHSPLLALTVGMARAWS